MDYDDVILPCAECLLTPSGVCSCMPPGRREDVYRVTCLCGMGKYSLWSPSPESAVRFWNREMGRHDFFEPEQEVYIAAYPSGNHAGLHMRRYR